MNSQELRAIQEAYSRVYESETGRGPRLIDAYDKPPYSDDVKDAPKYKPVRRGPKMKGVIKKEEVDIYDTIRSYLLEGGYAETPEAAEAIMVNMGEEWRENILEMDDFAAGGGNAKMKQTGMSKDQVVTLGKKNLANVSKKQTPTQSSQSSPSSSSSSSSSNDGSKSGGSDNINRDAIAMGMSPAAYRKRQIERDANRQSPTASADEREKMYQKSQGRASEISSWYGRDPKDPKTGKEEDDYAKADYARRLAMRNNDPNYDPTKAPRPTIQRAQRSSRDAWANPNAGN